MAETTVSPELQAEFNKVFGGQTPTASPETVTESAAPPPETQPEQTQQPDEFPEFTPAEGDSPDIAALKRTLKGSMTKATQRAAESRREYESKAAELTQRAQALDLILGAEDPNAVIAALRARMAGGTPQPQGGVRQKKLAELAKNYDEEQFATIVEIARTVWEDEAEKKLTPYQRLLEGMAHDRSQGEWAKIATRFPGADKYKDEAYALARDTGLPLTKALMAVSDGKVVENALKATVTQQRQIESVPPSAPPQQVTSNGSNGYSRDETAQKVAAVAKSLGLHLKYQRT